MERSKYGKRDFLLFDVESYGILEPEIKSYSSRYIQMIEELRE